ncbi:hypothetical protein ACFVSW_13465 [Neobacillus sp. NPDC058068]|uniref:hypothetical protein n=1 Tax=Neobacillus sp. NPDC058068 TaxID=3346325 RepID=UPI0036DDF916
MINEKAGLLKEYYQQTLAMKKALDTGKDEEVFALLEERQNCIAAIDKLDHQAGTILMNEQIKQQLQQQMHLERDVQQKLEQALKKLSMRMRTQQNETFLTKQYEEMIPVSKGIFYDSKK